MRRFYFDCWRSASVLRDNEGVLLSDEAAAIGLARLTVHDFCLSSDDRIDPEWSDCRLVVRSENGWKIVEIPFCEVAAPAQQASMRKAPSRVSGVTYLALERATRRLRSEGKARRLLLDRLSELLVRREKTRQELKAQLQVAEELRRAARAAMERSRACVNVSALSAVNALSAFRKESEASSNEALGA